MKKNDLTDVVQTKQGFLVLQVLEHYDEGEQAMAKVENEITDRLYQQRMEPAYRAYLKTLRQESYVIVKPGFSDTGGIGSVPIQEVQATPEANKAEAERLPPAVRDEIRQRTWQYLETFDYKGFV